MSAFLAFGILLLIIAAHLFLRQWMTLRLRWPKKFSYYSMTKRLSRYFLSHGWTIRAVDMPGIDMRGGKEDVQFAIRCYPSGLSMFANAISDLYEVRKHYPRMVLLIIAAEEVPLHFVVEALRLDVILIYYKDLPLIATLSPMSVKLVHQTIQSQIDKSMNAQLSRFAPGISILQQT